MSCGHRGMLQHNHPVPRFLGVLLISWRFCAKSSLAWVSFSSKAKGPGEEGAPRNHSEILSQKVADFECRFPYDAYGKSRAPFWSFLGEGFWGNIRQPLLLPAPLFYRWFFGSFSRFWWVSLVKKLLVLERLPCHFQNSKEKKDMAMANWKYVWRIAKTFPCLRKHCDSGECLWLSPCMALCFAIRKFDGVGLVLSTLQASCEQGLDR